MSGPRVEIIVGSAKKTYSIPKNLVCYWSSYFDKCLNSTFIEGQTQKVTLEEDNPEYFELLLKYMFAGGEIRKDCVDITQGGAAGMKMCMDYIEYTDKYGMGGASVAVHDSLERILPTTISSGDVGAWVTTAQVETVFRVAPVGSPLRTLITKAALSTTGFAGITFSKQERELDGFAAEMLRLMRPSFQYCNLNWTDPFNEHIQRSD